MNGNITPEILEKYEKLKDILLEMGKVAVAFSGGVDSTFLIQAAYNCLGQDALAITARHHAVPVREQDQASCFCKEKGIRMIPVEVNEMEIPGFRENPPDRCYLCKKAIFSELKQTAAQEFAGSFAKDWFLTEGSNMDDQGDYRPGMKAIKELEVRSPLMEAGLYKEEIRILSKMLELPTWNMPSFACLASRFVYGEQITPEKLKQVELAEEYLRQKGFHQYRVRVHGSLARIEVLPSEIDELIEHRTEIHDYMRTLGFSYVTMDLGGFQSGSMNRGLKL